MSAARIGRYELVRPLGRGAMGIVYLARDPQIERVLALKTVRFDGPHQSFSVEEAKARFLKEARISGRLQHPNIVTIFDVGEDQGTLFLAMEYISGGSLQQRLADASAPLPVFDRLRIVAEVADALAHAHHRGVIHRDIKPANILLSEQLAAKVTDFGIGKLVTGDADLTSTGQMVGSPAYMSPEQIKGEKLDVRSDIFSLGIVLYQTLTERKPFPADTLTTLVYQILNEEPIDPLAIRSDLPPDVVRIIGRCLAKKREDRYADVAQLADDLRAILGIAPVGSTSALSESKVARAREKAMLTAAQQAAMPTVMLDMTGRPMAPGAPARGAAVPPTEPAPAPPPGRTATGPRPLVAEPPTVPPGGQAPAEPPVSERSGARVERSSPPPLPGRSSAPSTGLLMAIAAVLVAVLGGGGFWLVRSGVLGSMGPVPTPAVPTPRPLPTPTPEPAPEPTPAVLAEETPEPGATETPALEPTPEPSAAPVVTPRPTRTPRLRPTPRPTAAAGAAPTKAIATPAPPTSDLTVVFRRFVKVNVSPDQARVYLNGRYVGIADDWDDSGGGALLTFLLEGRHRLRIAHPGKKDLVVDLVVSATAAKDVGEIDRVMDDGGPAGPPGLEGRIRRPSYRTVGPARFTVEPEEARVIVNGKDLGPASQLAERDLQLQENAVHEVVLEAPGYEPRSVRILCALSSGEARATVKEKLKKR